MPSNRWVYVVAISIIAIGLAVLVSQKKDAQLVPHESVAVTPISQVIGSSVEGRDITAVSFGSGNTYLLFVGGVHGGYEYNSVLLAYAFIDYFTEHPDAVPQHVTVDIIPNLNPDGVFAYVGTEGRFAHSDVPQGDNAEGVGRFNAHDVDLNRNFDCKWQPQSSWKGNTVSAGDYVFSEPEARTLRDFVLARQPVAVVFWHSKANTVYASECKDGVLPQTISIMHAYANAAGYGAVERFDAYPVTGDAEGWLASIGIPAITVELQTRDSIEWNKNHAGVEALLEVYKEYAAE